MSQQLNDHQENTLKAIQGRFSNLNPRIKIKDHVKSDLEVQENTLDGIKFKVKNRKNLMDALKKANDNSGAAAFAKGRKFDPDHWALGLSFAVTEGIGFREIWRFQLTTRSLQMAQSRPFSVGVDKLDGAFSANFGGMDVNRPDVSSLHCAVWDAVTDSGKETMCNIHIDAAGFTMTDANGNVILNPNLFDHSLNELGFKTWLRGVLPDLVVDRVNLVLPNSNNDYSRWGSRVDLVQTDTLNVNVSVSCSVYGCHDRSATINAIGKHDWLGGNQEPKGGGRLQY